MTQVQKNQGFATPAIDGGVDQEGFRTSSFSVRNPVIRFCVAAKVVGENVLVRDTKNPSADTLPYTNNEWQAFIAGVKAGEFDLA